MQGTEKQIEFAESILSAIEDADIDDLVGNGPLANQKRGWRHEEKIRVASIRAADQGDFERCEELAAELDGDGIRAIQCLIDLDTENVKAGAVIDSLKKTFYSNYAD